MTDDELKGQIAAQKALMIAVATAGPRIASVNAAYIERRAAIAAALAERQLSDPNPFDDLWAWYGRWQEPDLQHYQQRRLFIGALYKPVLDQIDARGRGASVERTVEPTGWDRVDRALETAVKRFDAAQNAEDFQGVGLLCREVIISLGQAVYDPLIHKPSDGVKPSITDANRMLDGFISHELKGASNEVLRKYAKASLGLAVELQHRRSAQYRDAAFCIEATVSLVNLIVIVSGRRDVKVSARLAPKASAPDSLATLNKLISGESLSTRLGRILKLLNAKQQFSGGFTQNGPDGVQVEQRLPTVQGRFQLHFVRAGPHITGFWYIRSLTSAAEIPTAMADVRVLLSECSQGQDTACTFILVTDEQLGPEKVTAYSMFDKMLVAVPEESRRLFTFEVWDEPILRAKETELVLRTDG
ncbi:MAG: hypothetical protein JWO19_4034 [Bryobacterales bacterium]|nr:hypothetical protein [Bryobacterales bacterium]